MFIRRRRLLWLVVVVGVSWVVISTYFVRSTDEGNARQHNSRFSNRASQTLNKDPVSGGAVHSSRLIPSKDFYYYDDNDEAVIDIGHDKSTPRPTSRFQTFRNFRVVTPAAYSRAESEIELKNPEIGDHFKWEKDVATRSSILRWRKEPTRKVQEFPSLEFSAQSKKQLTPSSHNAKQSPGNGYYIITAVYVCFLC